jgi:hypothetical protein
VDTPTDIVSEIAAGAGLSLAQAAKRFPSYRGGRPCNPSTVFRWVASGVVTPDGRRIRLEAARLNGRYLTTEAAIARFLVAQTPPPEGDTPARQTPTQRRRSAERAGRELDKIGI